MTKAFLILIFLCPALCFGQKLDLNIGLDTGVLNFDMQDNLISENQYDKSANFYLNLAAYRLKPHHFISLNFNTKSAQLNRSTKRNESNPIMLDFINYELNVEYLVNIYSAPKYFSAYIGAGYNGHFSFYEQSFNASAGRKSYEMALINLSFNSLLRWQLNRFGILLGGGLSLYNYGARPEEAYYSDLEKFRYFSTWAGNYTDFFVNLCGFYPITNRIVLKPQYRLRYYQYQEPEQLKLLKQAWSLGLYFKL